MRISHFQLIHTVYPLEVINRTRIRLPGFLFISRAAYLDFSNLFMQVRPRFFFNRLPARGSTRWDTSNPIFLGVSRRAGCSALPLSLPPSLSLPWFSQDASPGFKPDPVVSTVTNETSYNCQQRGEFGPRSGDASFLRNCAWTSRLCSPFLRNSRQRNSPTRGLIDSRAN